MISKLINIIITFYIGLAMISISSPSWSHEVEPAISQVSKAKAQNIVRQYLSSIGYSRAGTSVYSTSIGNAVLREDTWVVRMLTGKANRLPSKRGVVLVNAADGQIRQNLKD